MSDVYFDRANGERYIKQSWVIQQIKEEIRLIDKRATVQCASVTHNSANKMAKERYRRFLEKLLEELEK